MAKAPNAVPATTTATKSVKRARGAKSAYIIKVAPNVGMYAMKKDGQFCRNVGTAKRFKSREEAGAASVDLPGSVVLEVRATWAIVEGD
jgi:hypothetical protein